MCGSERSGSGVGVRPAAGRLFTDADGLTNLQESALDTDPFNPDRVPPMVETVDPAGGEDDVSDVETALRKQRLAADALLLGRVTFEQMRGYWPLQTDDTTGITGYLNGVSKYVLSNTLHDPEWERTAVLRTSTTSER